MSDPVTANPRPVGPLPTGIALLFDPVLNKGTAFTPAEREQLGLRGLLPPRMLAMSDQLLRIRRHLDSSASDLDRYVYLTSLQDRNETLFYRVIVDHLEEMMPIMYTPTVGEACRTFGHIFRRPRGLYISIEDRGRIREVLRNWPREKVSVIVATDGERILGLGDLGAYGMGIPIGKLVLYTACAGLDPAECLPIMLDVGTDNPEMLEDPLYAGLYQRRVRGEAYREFIEEFVTAVQQVFPGALLQWEDFATENALGLLERYRHRICSFNDDVQGTAAVTLAALLSACRISERPLTEQRILFLGAGASATGVAELMAGAMERQGLARAEARSRIWFLDSKGLVVSSRTDLAAHKRAFAQDHPPAATLAEAVRAIQPTALIGLSAQPQTFTEEVLRAMAAANERPIVFALSNPTSKAECTAEQAYRFTEGRVLFASGSPFDPVEVGGQRLTPSQANNAYIFPGLGLGVVLSRAAQVTDGMFHVAAEMLAATVGDPSYQQGSLLPPLGEIREVSVRIAAAVARTAAQAGLAGVPVPADTEAWVREQMFDPKYPDYTSE
jgi:malate dehydrogenase (oxaloacetate-decarboxylating)(NADP+)